MANQINLTGPLRVERCTPLPAVAAGLHRLDSTAPVLVLPTAGGLQSLTVTVVTADASNPVTVDWAATTGPRSIIDSGVSLSWAVDGDDDPMLSGLVTLTATGTAVAYIAWTEQN